MEKISAVYKIVNTVTGEFYIGSSVDVKRRWGQHRYPSQWKKRPNSLLYKSMQEYGVDKFELKIICSIMPECLKQVEQDCIQLMQPTYNNYNAKGRNVERQRETKKRYDKTYGQLERCKEARRAYKKKYRQSEKVREQEAIYNRGYAQTDKGKSVFRKSSKKYQSQLCEYNGETLTLNALAIRFHRDDVEHYFAEAKKYLI